MFKYLSIFPIIIVSLINPVYANFVPKESPPPKTDAQGTRGCPTQLGNLALFGTKIQQEQLTVELNLERPLLLFQVNSKQPEKVRLTITEVKGKFQRRQVYDQEVTAVNSDYLTFSLPKLDKSKKYLMTLMLLCQDKPQYGKTVHAWLNLVNYLTQVNSFVQSARRNEIQINTP